MTKSVQVVGMTHRYESFWLKIYGENLKMKNHIWGTKIENVMFPKAFFLGVDQLHMKQGDEKEYAH